VDDAGRDGSFGDWLGKTIGFSGEDIIGDSSTAAGSNYAATRKTTRRKFVVVRFTSIPSEAEVRIDGEYWGSTAD